MNTALNPFDLNLARAYSAPEAFCPRPELEAVLARASVGQVWTLETVVALKAETGSIHGALDDMAGAFRLLSELLNKHYGQKVVILLDEYDTPIHAAHCTHHWSTAP